MEPLVVICIPYYKCIEYIRRAVLSILNQTHTNLKVVVINDADFETPPWPELCDIIDNRLIRFDLSNNRGPYFATQVLIEAIQAPYLVIQDADDWSHPERIFELLRIIKTEKSNLAISFRYDFIENKNKTINFVNTCKPNQQDMSLDSMLKVRISHHGLFKVNELKNIGGYYGGYKISFDMLLTNIFLLTNRISIVEKPLYYYYKHPGSLTVQNSTGMKSLYRKSINCELQSLYLKAYELYKVFNSGKITCSEFYREIKSITNSNITQEDKALLKQETLRLKNVL